MQPFLAGPLLACCSRCNKCLKAWSPRRVARAVVGAGRPGLQGFHLGRDSGDGALSFLRAFHQQVSSCWAKLGFLGALSQGFLPVTNGSDSPALRMSTFVLARPAA